MTTEAPNIRRASAQDAPACAKIVHDWVNATGWMPERFTAEEIAGMVVDALPEREIYVIGDPVAGYLSFDPEKAHIVGFYVARRGQGLGKALLDHVKSGRDYLQLNTHAPNTDAHRFYAREGFEVAEHLGPGDDDLPEFRMEWRREGTA